MRAGRIETYTHSDSTTPNKGAATVAVLSQTDFAAKTPEFVAFASKAAKMAFAVKAAAWEQVVEAFPELEQERASLSKSLREEISVRDISVVCL